MFPYPLAVFLARTEGLGTPRTALRRRLLAVLLPALLSWWGPGFGGRRYAEAEGLPLRVEVIPVIDPSVSPGRAQRVLEKLLRGPPDTPGLVTLDLWFQRERRRYGVSPAPALVFEVRNPRKPPSAPPPLPPRASGFLERAVGERAALDYYLRLRGGPERAPKAVSLFLHVYDPRAWRARGRHPQPIPFASRRHRVAVVYLAAHENACGVALVHAAHEILHVLGARDRYGGCEARGGGRGAGPGGAAGSAGIMALGRVLPEGRIEPAGDLESFELEPAAAAEVGWAGKVPGAPPSRAP